uniref:Uncharacterized protein n=1 Tax=uncultured marine virus TaxID=186617 RepID=A0A0F7L8F4_9VIRU|nr:hypothetical protein [uncultured marine virus]
MPTLRRCPRMIGGEARTTPGLTFSALKAPRRSGGSRKPESCSLAPSNTRPSTVATGEQSRNLNTPIPPPSVIPCGLRMP